MNRIQAIKYTMAHRKALNSLARQQGYYFPLHDVDKLILYVFFGKRLTGKLHRLYSRHHERKDRYGKLDIKNKIEAVFDWECSRFTKKDKQQTAYEYWLSACPEVDLFQQFCMLGFLPKDKSPFDCWVEVNRAREHKYQLEHLAKTA